MLTVAFDPNDQPVHIDDTQSKLKYYCPYCGAPLITKKGQVRRHHFAHSADHACSDSWSSTYDISDWHFEWQERFPKQNRERCLSLDSTRHRADVIVGRTVIEFQKSTLTPQQFNDRNTFYHDLGYRVVWLFDLRKPFWEGTISESGREDNEQQYTWMNPKQAFNSYDIEAANICLFFQLEDDDKCIAQVTRTSASGFEGFFSRKLHTIEGFLQFVGKRADGSFDPPLLNPNEPSADYLRFKKKHAIRLNKEQERAVQVVDGNLLLLAVPGSGKTTTLVTRIGYLVFEQHIDPSSIICLTYTNAAVEDMRRRFISIFGNEAVANAIQFKTLNSLANSIYNEHFMVLHRSKRQHLPDNKRHDLLRAILKRHTDEWVTESDIIDLGNIISYIKNMMWENEVEQHFLDPIPEQFNQYQESLARQNYYDYDDQLLFAFNIVLKNRKSAIRFTLPYRYWCVDEAQDNSRIQHNLLYFLAGANGNVFMVGDEDQSIYGFRAAYPKAFLNFEHNYVNVFELKLEKNYRAGEKLVSTANSFIRKCKGRKDKRMVSARHQPSSIEVIDVSEREDQYVEILKLVKSSKGKLGILFRDNEGSIPLIDLFVRTGVEFDILSGKKTFFDSAVVRDVSAFLRFVLNPWDKDSFRNIAYKCHRYFNKKDVNLACYHSKRNEKDIPTVLLERTRKYRKKNALNASEFKTLVQQAKKETPAEAIRSFYCEGYGDYLDEKGISDSRVFILISLAQQEATIGSFLKRLPYLASVINQKMMSARSVSTNVVLSSIHSSKGLEYDTVALMDAYDDVLPTAKRTLFNASKDSSDTYQEERRLFYVAITRARSRLVLLRCMDEVTSFIDEVAPRGAPKKKLNAQEPSAPRYDIATWEHEYDPFTNVTHATCGNMDATITYEEKSSEIELLVGFEPSVLAEVAEHLSELCYRASRFVICVCMGSAQSNSDIRIEDEPYIGKVASANSDAGAACIQTMSSLMAQGATLNATFRNAESEYEGYGIESIDVDSRVIYFEKDQLRVD